MSFDEAILKAGVIWYTDRAGTTAMVSHYGQWLGEPRYRLRIRTEVRGADGINYSKQTVRERLLELHIPLDTGWIVTS